MQVLTRVIIFHKQFRGVSCVEWGQRLQEVLGLRSGREESRGKNVPVAPLAGQEGVRRRQSSVFSGSEWCWESAWSWEIHLAINGVRLLQTAGLTPQLHELHTGSFDWSKLLTFPSAPLSKSGFYRPFLFPCRRSGLRLLLLKKAASLIITANIIMLVVFL